MPKSSSHTGFTLIEIVVVLALLGLLGGAVFNLFAAGISAQRNTLSIQKSTNQLSYVAEYMGRALRQATKELRSSQQCLANVGRGWNYEISAGNDSITFLDKQGFCRKISLSANQIVEQIATSPDSHDAANLGPIQPLTPAGMTITNFRMIQQGAYQGDSVTPDNEQPRVTFVIEARGEGSDANIRIQTTVSQRNFDVVQ